jgi:hypothetical protein
MVMDAPCDGVVEGLVDAGEPGRVVGGRDGARVETGAAPVEVVGVDAVVGPDSVVGLDGTASVVGGSLIEEARSVVVDRVVGVRPVPALSAASEVDVRSRRTSAATRTRATTAATPAVTQARDRRFVGAPAADRSPACPTGG